MSKYKILWVIPLFFIISICGVLYFQKNISNDMSRSEIAYINNHLIIPDSQEIIEKGYPKNESGQTYGPDLSDYVGSVPDLILAESEDGIKGYLKTTHGFPLLTLFINILGAFLIGFISTIALKKSMNPHLVLLLKTGYVGDLLPSLHLR
jgi:hypothetical protein